MDGLPLVGGLRNWRSPPKPEPPESGIALFVSIPEHPRQSPLSLNLEQ
ncbi:hypothetical protein [Laspinema olomoucense]|nr:MULTISPECIES: hypothetical protein [unclassified Laspinema]MCT7974605.1 hypothetical protein [Laspinema sp. D3d]MCT7993625.1 hypothetical protein [Laspinema sp. D3c]